MGLDWIPCRIEPGLDPESVRVAAQLEFERFVKRSSYVEEDLRLLIGRSPFHDDEQDDNKTEPVSLADLLLFKLDSHRVYVISRCVILPPAWRLDGFRTILPSELRGFVCKWSTWMDEVRAGQHREQLDSFMRQAESIQIGLKIRDDVEDCLAMLSRQGDSAHLNAIGKDLENLSTTFQSAVVQNGGPLPWPQIRETHQSLSELIRSWNSIVMRGDQRLILLEPIPELEVWITNHQPAGDWFIEFLKWVKPYVDGGYGLYRDCE